MTRQALQQGFSLLEALMASAISAISIVGIYAMVNSGMRSLENAYEREELQAIGGEMLEVVGSSSEFVGLNISLTDCSALSSQIGSSLSAINQAWVFNWCERLNADLGIAGANAQRAIRVASVTQPEGTFRVVNIDLTDEGGVTRVALKKVFRESE